MSSSFEEAYAEVIVRVGLDLSPGQELLIRAPVEARELVAAVTRIAYKAGAKCVSIDYRDSAVIRAHYDLVGDDYLTYLPPEFGAARNRIAEIGDATLSILGADPEAFAGVDSERMGIVNRAVSERMRPAMQRTMKDHHNWCVVSAPTAVWATRVYPELPGDQALERLKESVATACRLDHPDPVAAWKAHSERLGRIASYLTKRQFDRFEYKAPGTELSVGMPANHVFVGTEGRSSKGNLFIANLPTDETFSAPDWRRVEGTIQGTRPSIMSGTNVGHVSLAVRDGRIVDFRAEQNEEVVQSELDLDEQARYFGEIAFVAESSPIAKMQTVFYDGLYDENAGCHLAFGNAYSTCLKGGEGMSSDELLKAGLNQSQQHFDFTIGSAALNITAFASDGTSFPILSQGEWSDALLSESGAAVG